MHHMLRRLVPWSLLVGILASTPPARAVDGVVLIDQNRALAGNLTAGDAPGFPVTISQPGSYRLAGHLMPPAFVDAIEVTAPNVTIDLNGFSLIAQPRTDPTQSDHGIVQRGPGAVGLTVANGSVVGFTSPFGFEAPTGPAGVLSPSPVVLRDLVLGLSKVYSGADLRVQPYSRIERVSGPGVTVYAQCPSTVVDSAFQTVYALQTALSIPGAVCAIGRNAHQ